MPVSSMIKPSFLSHSPSTARLLRRQNKIAQSIAQLENAHANTPAAHLVAQGNNARLLARAHLSNNDVSNFEKHMQRSVQLAQITGSAPDHTLTLHCLGMIYDEYARGYGRIGKAGKKSALFRISRKPSADGQSLGYDAQSFTH